MSFRRCRTMFRLLFAILVCAVMGNAGALQMSAQKSLAKTSHAESRNPNSSREVATTLQRETADCEKVLHDLDMAIVNAQELSDSYVIVIARLGWGESASSLNRRRLAPIENYLDERFPRVAVARGSRINELGRVEIYVGGKLFSVLPFKKNTKSFCP